MGATGASALFRHSILRGSGWWPPAHLGAAIELVHGELGSAVSDDLGLVLQQLGVPALKWTLQDAPSPEEARQAAVLSVRDVLISLDMEHPTPTPADISASGVRSQGQLFPTFRMVLEPFLDTFTEDDPPLVGGQARAGLVADLLGGLLGLTASRADYLAASLSVGRPDEIQPVLGTLSLLLEQVTFQGEDCHYRLPL